MPRLTTSQKLIVIRLIGERKEILFGSHSPKITQEIKERSWRSIIQECKEKFGFSPVSDGKNWKHLRDVTWFNWKKDAKEKRDKFSQTGAEGGIEAQMTEVESAVLHVLGLESPAVAGLPLQDQWDEEDGIDRNLGESMMDGDYSANFGIGAIGDSVAVFADDGRRHSWPEGEQFSRSFFPTTLGQINSQQPIQVSSASVIRRSTAFDSQPTTSGLSAMPRDGPSNTNGDNRARSDKSKKPSSKEIDDELKRERLENVKLHNELMKTQTQYLRMKMKALKINYCIQTDSDDE